MTISIGSGAANYGSYSGTGYTGIDQNGAANEAGIINSFEIWLYSSGSGVKVGTFYGSGTSYTNRDYESLGSVASGSKQTFSGLSCNCETGDLIGWYSTAGQLESDEWGSLKYLYKSGDKFGAGAITYSESVAYIRIALFGTSLGFLPFQYHYNNMRP